MNTKTQTYLENLLQKKATFQLSESDKALINHQNLEQFILNKLKTKKFRKTKLDPECKKRTLQAIKHKLKLNKPLNFVFPQGGYKLWRLPSSPTVDWAEFFNIAYLIEYLTPICQAYEPGLSLTYYMHTLLMEVHDNLETKEIQAYIESFQKLLDSFKPFLPKNMSISIIKDADIYPRKQYFQALEKGKIQAFKIYETFDQKKLQTYEKMAQLNIKWQGKKDWTQLNKKEKHNKITDAILYEIAAGKYLPKVTKKIKAKENILLFTKGTNMFIGIGSTKASIAKYWVGFGVLVKRKKDYLPIILSPSQYKQALKTKHKVEKIQLIDLKNFKNILVFEKLFSFNTKNS